MNDAQFIDGKNFYYNNKTGNFELKPTNISDIVNTTSKNCSFCKKEQPLYDESGSNKKFCNLVCQIKMDQFKKAQQ
jgi:hypothetical protein